MTTGAPSSFRRMRVNAAGEILALARSASDTFTWDDPSDPTRFESFSPAEGAVLAAFAGDDLGLRWFRAYSATDSGFFDSNHFRSEAIGVMPDDRIVLAGRHAGVVDYGMGPVTVVDPDRPPTWVFVR